jgi:hypothetical protein
MGYRINGRIEPLVSQTKRAGDSFTATTGVSISYRDPQLNRETQARYRIQVASFASIWSYWHTSNELVPSIVPVP